MGNWNDSLSKRLKADHFEAGPKLLTISKFAVEKIGDDRRPVVYFKEEQLGLVLNITNGNTIEQIAGTADTDEWLGVKVVLYQAETDYQGKRVPCIRVRKPKPGAVKAKPRPEPEPEEDEQPEFRAADDDVPF